jgi:hypothetical protein
VLLQIAIGAAPLVATLRNSHSTPIGARLVRLLLCVLLAAVPELNAAGRTLAGDPQNYLELVKGLQPGDTLQLAPGEYRRGLPVHRLVGTAQAPIVIRGPDRGAPAVFLAQAGINTVSIVDSAFVHIRDLRIDGRNVSVDAVKAEGHAQWAHHITLENLTIVNHGYDQQNVAISTKCPAWGWVIRGNRIHGAGTGMYLGDSDGSGAFYDGVIEHNLVSNPRGYAIQIKHQNARPAIEIAPRGRFTTIIRHNVLSKASGGSEGTFARPNLLVGHWPLSGGGSRDEYLIYGNYFHENPHEALFQGEGNVALYDNVFVNSRGPAIHLMPHNDVPRNVRVLHNTVVAAGDAILLRLKEGQVEYPQSIAGNVVFSPHAPRGGTQSGNLQFDLQQAGELLAAPPDPGGAFDPYPRNARLQCTPVDPQLLAGLIDAGCDFNGKARALSYCGAYAGHGRNPGWIPALTMKPRVACSAR